MTRLRFTTAALLALAPLSASAHAHLKTATPATDSTVTTAPSEVAIDFTEGVEPALCSIAVTGPGGARLDSGPPHVAAGDNKHLAVAVKPLAPGVYTVEWHATAVDTHKTEGTYHFTVAASAS